RKSKWEVGVGVEVGLGGSGIIRLAKSTLFYGTGTLTELRESLSTQIGGLNEKSFSTCKDIAAITPYCLSSVHTSVVDGPYRVYLLLGALRTTEYLMMHQEGRGGVVKEEFPDSDESHVACENV
ncbi:hypothetical protein V1478_014348, partial [Vespula squamosa]